MKRKDNRSTPEWRSSYGRRTRKRKTTIGFEIPRNIEQRLLTEGADPNREAKEVYLIDLYRQERITHDDLSEALCAAEAKAAAHRARVGLVWPVSSTDCGLLGERWTRRSPKLNRP
jgi:hypothetical protein